MEAARKAAARAAEEREEQEIRQYHASLQAKAAREREGLNSSPDPAHHVLVGPLGALFFSEGILPGGDAVFTLSRVFVCSPLYRSYELQFYSP